MDSFTNSIVRSQTNPFFLSDRRQSTTITRGICSRSVLSRLWRIIADNLIVSVLPRDRRQICLRLVSQLRQIYFGYCLPPTRRSANVTSGSDLPHLLQIEESPFIYGGADGIRTRELLSESQVKDSRHLLLPHSLASRSGFEPPF